MTVRCGLYLRVSTDNQTTALQRRELVEFCARRGWEVVATYEDIGVSGAKDSRPELNKLMADANRRRFDAVVVWKFDRFARSVSHLLRALETFGSLGIAFVSLSEQIDTSSTYGKMVFTILGAVAELERSLTAERVKAGMKSARARGIKLGRTVVAVDGVEVKRLRTEGKSFRSISRQMGISVGSIHKSFQRHRNSLSTGG